MVATDTVATYAVALTVLLMADSAWAQQSPPPATASEQQAQADGTSNDSTPENADRGGSLLIDDLTVLREALLDPQALPAQRRRWAFLLVRFEGDSATDLVNDLLQGDVPDDVKLSLLESLHDIAVARDSVIETDFAASLMQLLASSHEACRTEATHLIGMIAADAVADDLAAMIKDESLPAWQRTAAIRSLAPNIYDRAVLSALMTCLDVQDDGIRNQVLNALQPATGEPIGNDVEAWKRWWEIARLQSDQKLLADQSRFHRLKSKQLQEELETYRKEKQNEIEQLASTMASFQREILRTAKGDARQQRLVEWLGDPLPTVARTALAIIKGDMADDGVQPSDNMVTALLQLLDAEERTLQREALLIVQEVRDKAVLDKVLERLEHEQDQMMRLALLTAIRELDFKEALPALLEELTSMGATDDCVREASFAIDRIASHHDLVENEFVIVGALEQRYGSTPDDKTAVRGALLSAMAGVGHPAFLTEFLDAIQGNDAVVVRPAIRGLAKLAYKEERPRLHELVAHPDALVRREAIHAIRSIGAGEDDLDALLPRINPTNEPNALARQAAWETSLEILANRTYDGQIEGAGLFATLPEQELIYLESLTQSAPSPTDSRLEPIWSRLAELSLERDDSVKAGQYLRSLYQHHLAVDKTQAVGAGLQWLQVTLDKFPLADPGEVVAVLLNGDHSVQEWDQIIELLRAYTESDAVANDADRARQLHAKLESIVDEKLPPAWGKLLQLWSDRLAQQSTKEPQSTNGNG
ncbi:MAG: HEAT repeat domain-containing protein [Phycisphaerae bacterium]